VTQLRGKVPVADFAVSLNLDLPDIKASDLPIPGLPAGPVLPAAKIEAKAHLTGDAAELKALKVKTRFGTVEAVGTAKSLFAERPNLDVTSSFDLDLPAFKSGDVPWAKLPPALAAPASRIKGKVRLQGDTATISNLAVKTSAGTVEVAGTARKIFAAMPDLDLGVSMKLDLPAIKSSELPVSDLPAGFTTPAVQVEGKLHVKGDLLEIASLHVRSSAGNLQATGQVKGVMTGKYEPNLDVTANLSLPAIKSADVPLPQVPPGLVVPASRLDAGFTATLDEVKIRSIRVVIGKNDVELDGGRIVSLRSGSPLFGLLIKCRSFDLAEITGISPQTRELGLSGSGFFAMGVTGKLPKPILEGKMQFKGMGATVAGVKLADFTGTAKFDEKRIDIPNLVGKVDAGDLNMDFTVKNYATAPDIDLEATLTEFDLGKFLAAKAQITAPKAGAASATASAAAPGGPPIKPPPIDIKGRFEVDRLVHPNAEAKKVKLFWELRGVTPDLKSLGGTASLHSGSGKFTQLGSMAGQSKVVKVLVMPLLVFQKIGRLGGLKLFPDFNNVTYTDLAGDYSFANGDMALVDSHLYSDAFNVTAKGDIDLPAEKLALTVTAQVGNVAPVEVAVRGTFDNPKTHAKIGKFIENIFKPLPK
jgi:hypothetical protein